MILKFGKAIAVCALSTLFVGCAGGGKYNAPSYYDGGSKAYNISFAGWIREGMKDRHAPEGYNKLGEAAFDSADLYATYFMNPSLGLTNWGSLGLGILSKIAGPKPAGQRNTLIAWMPVTDPNIPMEAAHKQLDSIVNDAVISALAELKISHSYEGKGDYGQHIFKLKNDALDCSERTSCSLEYRIDNLAARGPSPDYIDEPSDMSIAFTGGGKYKDDYNWLEINSDNGSSFPQQDLYLAISRNLPGWAYIYLAANEINTGNGKKITYPLLLGKGKPELFIYPTDY